MKQVSHLIFAMLVFFQLYSVIYSYDGEMPSPIDKDNHGHGNIEGSKPSSHESNPHGSGISGGDDKKGGFFAIFVTAAADRIQSMYNQGQQAAGTVTDTMQSMYNKGQQAADKFGKDTVNQFQTQVFGKR